MLKYKVKLNVDETCSQALNGKEAFELIKRDAEEVHDGKDSSYELIFMDCNMPIMDGY